VAICGATGANAQGAQEDYPQNTSGMTSVSPQLAFEWDDLTMDLTYLILFNHQ